MKRLIVEFGMGTDLRGADYTKAAVRALTDALWHNSVSVYRALGFEPSQMHVEVEIGVAKPERVDKAAIAAVLPYGICDVSVVRGGLDVPKDDAELPIVIANAAAIVYLDMAE